MKRNAEFLPVLAVLAVILAAGCKGSAVPKNTDPSMRIRDIYAGVANVFIIKEDGTLWAAGESLYGELGLGGDGTGKLPVFTQLKSGGIHGEAISGVRAAAAGNYHTAVLKTDGTVWIAGENYYGQLSLGEDTGVSPALKKVYP